MTNDILMEMNDQDIKSAMVPIECLSKLKADIIRFRETENLNGFQKWNTHEGYVLDVPVLPFEPKSILTIAIRHKLAHVIFNYNRKNVKDIYFTDQLGTLRNFLTALAPKDLYQLNFNFWLPNKRLAVCSGLAEYGRNNVTCIDGWGNFFVLYSYLTDMPCEGDYIWRDVKNMDVCTSCGLCVRNCPTKAIRDDRFLIDNEICFTHFEESDMPFPDWLPGSAYHSVFGCFRCLEVCPENKEVLKNIDQTVRFSETETGLLMAGAERKDMPEDLLHKIERLGIDDWRLKILPKALKAVFAHA